VQTTGFDGPEVLDVVDLHDPEPGPGEWSSEISAARIDHAGTSHCVS
jgi:NADPH:quinone reductase-like Zn-dependent oxidoreductase